MNITLLAFLFLILSTSAWAQKQNPYSMDGYKLSDFKDFDKKWNVVTVRFRKDSGEIRFVYANALAWQTLIKGEGEYPDGAVFGKISLATKKDINFPSSLVPSNGRRIQFMVKNQSKHKTTGGWGFSIFSMDGKRHPGNVKKKQNACYACHTLAREEDFVFSNPMQLISLRPRQLNPKEKWRKKIKFKVVTFRDLPPSLQKKIPKQKVRLITGILAKSLFYGTLDEIRPTLIEEVKRTNTACALVSKDGAQFSVVFINHKKTCPKKGQLSLKALHTVPNKDHPFYEIEICE